MTSKPKYTVTTESIILIHEGKTHNVKKGSPNFEGLRKAVFEEDWDTMVGLLTIAKSVTAWAKGEFSLNVAGNKFYHRGKEIPGELNDRIFAMVTRNEDPQPLFNFVERLDRNPSWRSRTQLYDFLEHQGIPLVEDGCFLAYKAVNANWTDCHSSTLDNHVGAHNHVDRNEVSDDPEVACHFGLHVGALAYAESFCPSGGHIVVCRIDPEHVVCIPKDCNCQKMRVCDYDVVAHHGSLLPSTTYKPEYEDEYDEDDILTQDDDDDELTEEEMGEMYEEAPKPQTAADGGMIYEEMDELDEEGLLLMNLDKLRKYASNHLKIAGASKIPGGKLALVNTILQVRN